jgi:hypothetical protein
VDRIATGWTVRGSNPGEIEISRTRPSCPGDTQPPIQWVLSLFPGLKRPRRDVNLAPPSSADVEERVELYLYSPSYSVASCPVGLMSSTYGKFPVPTAPSLDQASFLYLRHRLDQTGFLYLRHRLSTRQVSCTYGTVSRPDKFPIPMAPSLDQTSFVYLRHRLSIRQVSCGYGTVCRSDKFRVPTAPSADQTSFVWLRHRLSIRQVSCTYGTVCRSDKFRVATCHKTRNL